MNIFGYNFLLILFFSYFYLLTVADSRHSDEHQTNQNHFFKTRSAEHRTSVTQIIASECTTPVASSKPWSLLVGDSPNPTFCQESLSRSKSSDVASQPIAASASHRDDDVSDVKESTKKEESASFFSRLLLRRSSKKKKNAIDEPDLSGWKAISNEHVSLPSHKEEPTSMVYANGGLMKAVKHHPLFRQRVESSNLVSPEDVALPSMSYSSTVPVNMTEDVVNMVDSIGEVRQRTMHKSHSFRNSEKLPYVWCEDTPSLPVHIGLIDESYTEDTFPKRYSSTTNTSFANVELSNTCEPTVIRSEVNHWIWSSTTNEYEDTSTINRLNISVNEEDDIIVDMQSDKVANSNIAQVSKFLMKCFLILFLFSALYYLL